MPKVVLIDKRQLPVGAITHSLSALIKKALSITPISIMNRNSVSVVMLIVIILRAVMLSVVIKSSYTECSYTECHYAKCRYAVACTTNIS